MHIHMQAHASFLHLFRLENSNPILVKKKNKFNTKILIVAYQFLKILIYLYFKYIFPLKDIFIFF